MGKSTVAAAQFSAACVLLALFGLVRPTAAAAAAAAGAGRNVSTTPGGYVQLDAVMKNTTKYEGETVRIKCEITGFPLPRYVWYKDGVPVDQLPNTAPNHFTAKITPWGSRLKIEDMTTDDSGIYTCEGSNSFDKQSTNGTVFVRKGPNPNRDWLSDLENDGDDLDIDMEGFGEDSNTGLTDDTNFGKKSGSKSIPPKRKPDQVRPNKDADDSGVRDGYCQPYRGAACARFVGNKSIYVRTNTELGNMEESLTARLTIIATANEISQKCAESVIPALCHFAFPLCDLTSRRSRPRRVCLEDCEMLEKTLCKNEYQAAARLVSKSDMEILPDCMLHADESDNCIPIGFAGFADGSFDVESADTSGRAKDNSVIHIIVPCLAIPLCIVLLVVGICLYRRCRNEEPNKETPKGSAAAADQESMLLKPSLNARDFPISSIRFMQELGEGNFGKVCRGELVQYAENNLVPIVVKTLRPGSTARQCTSFWNDAERQSKLKHPNVLTLLGVCSRDQPFCMMFEYYVFGDLHEYLVVHSPNSDISFSDSTGQERVLREPDMMSISNQIASGMEYLSSHGIVHGDVAARNMLVGEGGVMKISDLGISRNVYPLDYYPLPGMPPVPVRWMPGEAIQYGKFSTKSDVWSFGVTLWEVYSYGLQPYYGHSNQDVVNLIQTHQILPCPKDCSSRVYSLMVECWHKTASHRPTFQDVHQRLCQWRSENCFTGMDNSRTNQLPPDLPYNLGYQGQGSSSQQTSPGLTNTTGPAPVGYPHGPRPPVFQPPYPMGNHLMPTDEAMLVLGQGTDASQAKHPAVLFKKSSSSASSGTSQKSSNLSSQFAKNQRINQP